MNYSRVVSVAALAFVAPLAAGVAQTAPTEEPSKWSLSLGVDPTHLNLSTRDPGVDARIVGNLTRIWSAPNSRFSRQISLMVGADAPRNYSTGAQDCYACSFETRYSYAGLTAGGAVDLFRFSRFTPYVQSGAGFYYTRSTSQPANGIVLSSQAGLIYARSQFSLGVNGGFGIKARFGSHEFFVEQMLHAFDFNQINQGVYPLNFGFKF